MSTAVLYAVENLPQSESVNDQLCIGLVENMEELLAENPNDKNLQFQLAVAYVDMWWAIQFRFSQHTQTYEHWPTEAKGIAERLVASDSENADYHHVLAYACHIIALELQREPKKHLELALHHSGIALGLEPHVAKRRWLHAGRLIRQAQYLKESGQVGEGMEYWRRGSEMFAALMQQYPDNADYRGEYAWLLMNQGLWEQQTRGDRQGAMRHFLRAKELLSMGYRNSSAYGRFRMTHIHLLRRLGMETNSADLMAAEAYFREAAEMISKLRSGFADSEWVRQEFGATNLFLAEEPHSTETIRRGSRCSPINARRLGNARTAKILV